MTINRSFANIGLKNEGALFFRSSRAQSGFSPHYLLLLPFRLILNLITGDHLIAFSMAYYNNKFHKGRFYKTRPSGRFKYNGRNKRYGYYDNRYQRDPILQEEEYELTPVCGVFRRNEKGAVLRKPERDFRPEESEIYIRQDLCRRFGLVQGAYIEGGMAEINGKKWVIEIYSINGLVPEIFRFRPQLKELPAVAPDERFDLSISGDESMRIVDLMAPIGKGTRALIVSPPKAGKTTILEKLAASIKLASPESHVIVLLVDERP